MQKVTLLVAETRTSFKIICFAVSSSEADNERNIHSLSCVAKFPHTTLKLLWRYFIPKIQQFPTGDPLVWQKCLTFPPSQLHKKVFPILAAWQKLAAFLNTIN